MKPSRHVIASAFAGGLLAFFTKSVYAGILCLASGVLVDFDHVIEYIIHHRWKNLSLGNIYHVSEQTNYRNSAEGFKKLYLLFHSAEIAILLLIAAVYTKNIYILAIATGYSLHIILDCIGNPMQNIAYFILWRATKGFETDKLFDDGKC